ncbi:mechanosensitive ion channel family protein [Nodosilinea sp. LEGE 06152]|uniref:mechanosensitive ion channel family protein n=1 Tax=Nodosilinea sp. LEGE 06152 TaxID=2777966 RepID=UPI001D146E2A|nr:mechanosensitive ion channel family protein [Nodosilinea sp. LEGE 06152]
MVRCHRCFRSTVRLALLGFMTVALVLGSGAIAHSQLPSLPTANSSAFSPPDGVSRHGEYETASIRSPLDRRELFEVTSPTVLNRDRVPEGLLPVEVRAEEVNERLWRLFYRAYASEPSAQPPVVTIATLSNQPIIQASDDQSSRPIRLVTVTEPDADFNGKTLDELAQEWQTILQAEIVRFRELGSPEVIAQRIGQALQILLGLLLASAAIWWLRRRLTRRQQTLESRYQEQLAAIAVGPSPPDPEDGEAIARATLRSQVLARVQHSLSVQRQLEIGKFLTWLLFWVLIVMWYVGIARILSTVPLLMRWSLYAWTTPLVLMALWFGISLAIRISSSLINRLTHSWKTSPYLVLGEAERISLRATTISNALKGLTTSVLVIIGIIWTLSLFNIPTGSILAGGAVIGLAVSFGSQSLVKDLVNGCLILIEDQFAVGDVVQIGERSGLVENLNLRVTQLRNSEGQLITIPNSTITDVSNLTRLWSRVDFSVVAAYENDPKQVLSVLQQVCDQLYREPEWRDRLPEPPTVLGVDDLSHTGMLVRVWLKTAPMQQWIVGREFRLRVRQAFETNNIQIGKPQTVNYNTGLADVTPHN